MEYKLKPCPFCGGKAKIRVIEKGIKSIIECTTHYCGFTRHSYNNGETDESVAFRLTTAWNRRADVVPRSEVEELETKLHLAEEAFRVASENAESARDRARSIASEIFEEIEKILFYLNDFTINDIELEQPEQVGAEVICYEFQDKLETLRKKYIGETE
jgi:hypothetical protein